MCVSYEITNLYLPAVKKRTEISRQARRHPVGRLASCSAHPLAAPPPRSPNPTRPPSPGGGDWASGAALRQVSFGPIAGGKFRLGTPTPFPSLLPPVARERALQTLTNASYLCSDPTQFQVFRCITPTDFDSTRPPIGSSIGSFDLAMVPAQFVSQDSVGFS